MREQQPSDSTQLAVGLPVEPVVVWALFAVVTAEILVTYARLPARDLYHTSGSGLAGGASRALVFLGFPTALVAIAILGLLFERVQGRGLRLLAVAAALLCASVAWPGVVDEADLDAKPVNAFAAAGVLLALLLTIAAARRAGLARSPRQPGDLARAFVAPVLVVLATPWIAAELGFFLDGVPLLGNVFQTGRLASPGPGLAPIHPSVHHGHHHGMDGLLLAVSALLLSRALVGVRRVGLRRFLAAYIALMFVYGVANVANDLWVEQVFKRGWASWLIPNVLEPRATIAWGVLIAAAVALWAISSWWVHRRRPLANLPSG